MSNVTAKKKIKGYSCTINWFCVGKFDTLTITIDKFDKVLGATTDRNYVEKILGIEASEAKQ
jgi:hypothetical protein